MKGFFYGKKGTVKHFIWKGFNSCPIFVAPPQTQAMVTLYFTALVLPENLNAAILPFKQYMKEEYGCKVGLKSPAHITLLPPFRMAHSAEEDLVRAIDDFSRAAAPFSVRTAHFSAFRPRTLFVDVAPSTALSSLKAASDRYFGGHPLLKVKIDTRPFHPHITIATRDLERGDFETAWRYFKDKSFEEEWIVNGISLLRHNTKNWDVVHTSQFVDNI